MRDYVIMTDSCCDLSQQEVEELDLTVLPLSFTIEGKTLLNTPDHADMSPEEFFQKIAAGADCTTAAVNVGQFTDAMEKVLLERTVHHLSVRLYRCKRPARKASRRKDCRDRLPLRLARTGNAALPCCAGAPRKGP